jgi:hypothetical protein
MATVETGTIDTSSGASAQDQSQFDVVLEKGKEYLDTAVSAAKENPWTAAAVGAGVVAAAAATAYGATKLTQRSNGSAPAKSTKSAK